jgi:hypothetical protein
MMSDNPSDDLDGLMDDTQRDPELAAVLAVAPLDDLTRARLVRTAIVEPPDASRPDASRTGGRLTAALGVAAALVIGAMIGTLVVTRPDDPEPTTAARAPATSPAPSSPAPASPAEAGAPAFEPAAATLLGDLGAVASVSALRDAIAARLEAADERAVAVPGGAATADGCVARGPDAAGLVVISAVGTATLGSTPVVVLVGPTPGGENLAVTLDPTSCAVLQTVTLQG